MEAHLRVSSTDRELPTTSHEPHEEERPVLKPPISLPRRGIVRMLLLLSVSLTLASAAANCYRYSLGATNYLSGTLIPLLDVVGESNLPTWYASSTLLLCALLLAAVAAIKKRDGARYISHWRALAVIFLYLSLDEAAQIHERTTPPLRELLNAWGVLYGFLFWSWVVLFGALTLIFVLAYLRFLAHLPPKTRQLFLIAGALYAGGALGGEVVGGHYASLYGRDDPTVAIPSHVEELAEMLGVAIFIYALLSYIRSHIGEIRIRIDE